MNENEKQQTTVSSQPVKLDEPPVAKPLSPINPMFHIPVWTYFLSWIVTVFVLVLAFGSANLALQIKGLPTLAVLAITLFGVVAANLTLIVVGVGIVVGLSLFIHSLSGGKVLNNKTKVD